MKTIKRIANFFNNLLVISIMQLIHDIERGSTNANKILYAQKIYKITNKHIDFKLYTTYELKLMVKLLTFGSTLQDLEK